MHSVVSAARRCIRYGVVLTIGIVFATSFESVENNWDFHLKPFSHDLGVYCEYVRDVVLVAFWVGFMLVISPVIRVLDRFVPRDRADATPVAENAVR